MEGVPCRIFKPLRWSIVFSGDKRVEHPPRRLTFVKPLFGIKRSGIWNRLEHFISCCWFWKRTISLCTLNVLLLISYAKSFVLSGLGYLWGYCASICTYVSTGFVCLEYYGFSFLLHSWVCDCIFFVMQSEGFCTTKQPFKNP